MQNTKKKPLIILDRDGVINNDSDLYIKSAAEWIPLASSINAIGMLCKAGYQIAVATNQSGLARGLFSREDLDQMHKKMHQLLAVNNAKIDALHFCPHHPNDNCACRKPKPGLLQSLAKELDREISNSIFIGDSLSDITAAKACGAQPVLVLTGKGQRSIDKATNNQLHKVPVFTNLLSYAEFILEQT